LLAPWTLRVIGSPTADGQLSALNADSVTETASSSSQIPSTGRRPFDPDARAPRTRAVVDADEAPDAVVEAVALVIVAIPPDATFTPATPPPTAFVIVAVPPDATLTAGAALPPVAVVTVAVPPDATLTAGAAPPPDAFVIVAVPPDATLTAYAVPLELPPITFVIVAVPPATLIASLPVDAPPAKSPTRFGVPPETFIS
jgi:hypothetical protein